jgi:hypothetical protein
MSHDINYNAITEGILVKNHHESAYNPSFGLIVSAYAHFIQKKRCAVAISETTPRKNQQ